jgi:ATP-dependent Zn protease
MAAWDRLKILTLLGGLFTLLFWADLADNPIIPVVDAFNEALARRWWLVGLIGLEVLRQLHYLVSERSPGYHKFWTEKVFGGTNRRLGRINDWNRYRMGRALRFLVFLTFLAIILGAIYDTSPVTALFELPASIWAALPFIIQMVFFMLIVVMQFVAIFWFLSKGGTELYFPDDIKTRFSDVWGQDSVLARVKENILYLENPEKVEEKGGYVPGGILLWGPPGTGKTLMAEAVAGETGRPYVFVDPGAFQNMFFGVGILKVKSLFRKLRKLALRYGGVIVFFDEADSLGNRGGAVGQGGGVFRGFGPAQSFGPWAATPGCNGMSYLGPNSANLVLSEALDRSAGPEPPRRLRDRIIMGAGMGGGGMGTLQALLTELSGLKKPRGFVNRVVRRTLGMRPKPPPKYRILVMMATNMPQALDEALLRPGRIDRIYRVGYPSKIGRLRTFEGYLDKVSHSLTPQEIDKLATITPYHTGATIKDLVNEALILAIRDGRDTIVWRDVIRAKQLKTLGPPEDVEYIQRERHAVAVHEACHAVTAYRVRRHFTIDIATIEKGSTYLGMVASVPPEEQFTQWRSEFEADIMVSLASLAGERMFFDGDNSSGVQGDLNGATLVAAHMEGYWGMGSTIAFHDVLGGGDQVTGRTGRGTENDLLLRTLGQRVERKLEELLHRSEQLLRENRTHVLAVAHALETHKTLTGEDVEAIIEGRSGPLVDGRIYANPVFAELAEAYHAQAVAAHKGHGVLDAPLPTFNGHGRHTLVDDVVVIDVEGSSNGPNPWARPASDEG